MSDDFQREWRFYLNDMIEFAGKVLTYTKRLDQAGFVANDYRDQKSSDPWLSRHR